MASQTDLCLLETNRIAIGYSLLDQLLKDYPITLVKQYRICPGKAFFLLGADTDIVKQIECILKHKECIQYRVVTGIHPDVLSVFQHKKIIPKVTHLGIYECTTSVSAFHLANYLAWHHQVDLLHIQSGVGLCGKSIISIAASYTDLKTIENQLSQLYPKDIVSHATISDPAPELLSLL